MRYIKGKKGEILKKKERKIEILRKEIIFQAFSCCCCADHYCKELWDTFLILKIFLVCFCYVHVILWATGTCGHLFCLVGSSRFWV